MGDSVSRGKHARYGCMAVSFAFLLAVSCVTPEIIVATPDFKSLPDGSYEGYHDGKMVIAKVDVRMKTGRIDSIAILEHVCGLGKPAEAIVDDVIKSQTLDVDTVSGSTYSSKVILKAVENALSGKAK